MFVTLIGQSMSWKDICKEISRETSRLTPQRLPVDEQEVF